MSYLLGPAHGYTHARQLVDDCTAELHHTTKKLQLLPVRKRVISSTLQSFGKSHISTTKPPVCNSSLYILHLCSTQSISRREALLTDNHNRHSRLLMLLSASHSQAIIPRQCKVAAYKSKNLDGIDTLLVLRQSNVAAYKRDNCAV